MFITRTRSILLVTPFLLAGSLLLSGCGGGTSATEDTASVVEETDGTETDVEILDMREDRLNGVDDALNTALGDLSARLDAAAPGLEGVGLTFYVDSVDVSLVVDDENTTPAVAASDLRGVLTEIATFSAAHPEITEWVFNAWDLNGWNVNITDAATELELDPSVIDEEWDRLTISSDVIGTL